MSCRASPTGRRVQAVQPLDGLVLLQREVAGGVPEHGAAAGALGVDPQRDLLGHRAARHQHRRGLAEQRGDLTLQLGRPPRPRRSGRPRRRRGPRAPRPAPPTAAGRRARSGTGCTGRRSSSTVGSAAARRPARCGVAGRPAPASVTSRPARAPRGRRGRAAAPPARRTEPSACWWFSRIATIQRVVASVPLSVASGRLAVVVAQPDPQPAGLERRAVRRRGQLAVAALGRHPRLAVELAGRRAARGRRRRRRSPGRAPRSWRASPSPRPSSRWCSAAASSGRQ